MDIFYNDWSLRCVTLVSIPDHGVSQLWRKISIKAEITIKALVTAAASLAPVRVNVQTRRGTLTLPTLCPAQGRARVLQAAVRRIPEYHNME